MVGTRAVSAPLHWFRDIFGFTEHQNIGGQFADFSGEDRQYLLFQESRSHFEFEDGVLRSKDNGRSFHVGPFEMPCLRELRSQADAALTETPDSYWSEGELTFHNITGCARELHRDPENEGAVFQVATLFNCLVCPPGKNPADGVSRYAAEASQGPACSVACPAALVYRNYFVNDVGQANDSEIDCLSDMARFVNNEEDGYWSLRSGYCLQRVDGSLAELSGRIVRDAIFAENLRSCLQVGIHWDTEVEGAEHRVCQVLCAGLPVGLDKKVRVADWEGFARSILFAAFDATLTVGSVLAAKRGKRVKIYLTALGGGVLGNRKAWIADALDQALNKHKQEPLDVLLVHFANFASEKEFVKLERGRAEACTFCFNEAEVLGKSIEHNSSAMQNAARTMTDLIQQMKAELSQHGSVNLDNYHESLSRFDGDADGRVNEQELQAIESWNSKYTIFVAKAFAAFDANGDGVIDRQEFVDALQNIDPGLFTPKTVEILLQEADSDGDGVVHYLEFVAWLFHEDPSIVSGVLGQPMPEDDDA